MSGIESVALIGWHPSFYHSVADEYGKCQLLGNLAGNSFSAFSVLPIVICGLALVEFAAQSRERLQVLENSASQPDTACRSQSLGGASSDSESDVGEVPQFTRPIAVCKQLP